MTQGFDEWWKEFSGDKYLPENQFIGIAYKAGAASRQAEIDDSENTRAVLYRENMDLRESNIELQKRINDALNHTINHGGYNDLTHIINILKGDSNE